MATSVMRAAAKHLLTILAVLAVGCAQIAGMTRGYVCYCTGDPVFTDEASCDAAVCHPGHDHSDDGDEHHGGPHEHQTVTESLKSVSFVPLILTLPPLMEMACSPAIPPGVQLAREMAERRAELKPPDDTGGSPPASVLVARTMVMLV